MSHSKHQGHDGKLRTRTKRSADDLRWEERFVFVVGDEFLRDKASEVFVEVYGSRGWPPLAVHGERRPGKRYSTERGGVMKVQGEAVCFSISKYWSMSCRDPMMEEAAQKKSRNWLFACLCGVQSRRPQETRATMDVSDEERSSNGLSSYEHVYDDVASYSSSPSRLLFPLPSAVGFAHPHLRWINEQRTVVGFPFERTFLLLSVPSVSPVPVEPFDLFLE
ncbi:hypothetical protein GW17_00031644 [Ensete ventricosum]|nr:hypothetical protein GW17_00031644 [Ensete ventricosum]